MILCLPEPHSPCPSRNNAVKQGSRFLVTSQENLLSIYRDLEEGWVSHIPSCYFEIWNTIQATQPFLQLQIHYSLGNAIFILWLATWFIWCTPVCTVAKRDLMMKLTTLWKWILLFLYSAITIFEKKHFSEEGQGYQVPCENFLVAFKWIPAISVLTGGGGWRTKCIYYEEEHHFLGWGHSRSSARPRVRKSKTLHHPWICFLELFPPSCQKKRWRNKDVYVNLFTKHGEEMCAMQENNSSFQKR